MAMSDEAVKANPLDFPRDAPWYPLLGEKVVHTDSLGLTKPWKHV